MKFLTPLKVILKLRKDNNLCLLLPKTQLPILQVQNFSKGLTYFHPSNTKSITDVKIFKNLSNKINLFDNSKNKHRLKTCAVLLYENIVDKLDYSSFYKEFSMTDTFFSWFLITEVHVWMLMLRLMQENKDGLRIRNFIVEVMWNDVKIRTKKLGGSTASVRKSQINLLSEQFNAAIMTYDAGITADDIFFADQVWKRFFQAAFIQPIQLEKFVHYIRKQVNILNTTATSELISLSPNIIWINL